jgi:hypothetical protein
MNMSTLITKRTLLVILVAGIVMLAVGAGSSIANVVQALPPMAELRAAGVTIPYAGRLADDAGEQATDGVYEFTFVLYTIESGGEPLWSEVQEGVLVRGGSFSTSLGNGISIPQKVLDGSPRWLAVAVRGPGEADFTALVPRQRLSVAAPAVPSSPSNGAACPHDHFGEEWIGASADSGLYVENTDSTGGAGVVTRSSSGAALVIGEGALQVTDAGLDMDTPVFIHQVRTSGSDANLCTEGSWHQDYSTVIDHPMTNDNQNAILFVTPNYGLASSAHDGPAHAPYGVYYDDQNQCGFGNRWVIYAYDGTTLNDGQMFNVLVVIP